MTAGRTEIQEQLRAALGDAYELGEFLGAGGFAVVYAARDRALNRDVAIKALRPELDAPIYRERFRREAESIARLRHPNIMPIYAVGDAAGIAWFAMPRILGETLGDRLKREQRLPPAEVHRILTAALGALAFAHRNGVVHRDVKPDNVMLDGDERHVVLTDFGIARAVQGDGDALTATGIAIGTPQYMAPEQIAGEKSVDHRADLYSLGVVAFEMLTGRLPFAAPSMHALILKQASEPTPPVLSACPDCPGELAAIVDRCLEKDPKHRWTSAESVLSALQGGAQAMPAWRTGKSPISARSRAARGIRRAFIGGVVAIIAGALIDALIIGSPAAAPLLAIAAIAVIAHRYAGFWMKGGTWPELLPYGVARVRASGAHTPVDHPAIQQARSERAACLAAMQKVPRAERESLDEVPGLLDTLVARISDLERQTQSGELERARTELATIDGRMSDTQAGTSLAERHGAVLARRRESLRTMIEQRAKASEARDEALAALEGIRYALDRLLREGGSTAAPSIAEALAAARAAAMPTSRELVTSKIAKTPEPA